MTSTPSISMIVGSPTDDLSYVTTILRGAARQPQAGQIEMIVVSPATAPVLPPDALRPFFNVKTVQSPLHHWADAMAAGIPSASAPIVVLAEDHAFPQP